ncbi:MAG: hypothetical protein ACLGGX_12285 [Bdellovibrionia bacterium]
MYVSSLINNKGITLTQVLVMMSVISISSVAILNLMESQKNVQTEMNVKTTLMTLRQNILGTIGNHYAWSQTRTKNFTMQCLSPSQPYCNPNSSQRALLALYDSSGTLLYDSTDPQNGFTLSGQACNTYSVNGNDNCPIRIDIEWRGACAAVPCADMEDMIHINFAYSPSTKSFPLNTSNYNVLEQPRTMVSNIDSPFLACAENQKIYIGSGQSFRGIAADAQGCVPYAAFVGPTGERGPTGFQGPQGPPGPSGPPGSSAICP